MNGIYTNALTWAYWFVVHDGKVYEVIEDEILSNEEVGNVIGEVETKADEYSGKYTGNASNYYDIGTRYFEINHVSPKDAIAVEIERDVYVKAIYSHDAPFSFRNIVFNRYTLIITAVVIVSVLSYVGATSRQR